MAGSDGDSLMPEGRLERTRRAYAPDPQKTWARYRVEVEGRRAYVLPIRISCGICGGAHSDGSVCTPLEPDDQHLWGV